MTLTTLVAGANSQDKKKEWTRPTTHWQLPSGTDTQLEGVDVRCFTVVEGKIIKRLTTDYDDLFYAAIRWEAMRLALEAQVAGLELRLEFHIDMVTELQADRKWWKELFQAEHKYRMKLELAIHKTDRWKWVPWS